ncbi:universal stress protein [Motiliproteus sp. MSK22-1]|uniref:universal stress protein n=1 Tax=Motiliproteus sp. MSK22-1 TaxID=1897630 RepID=UPI0009774872|nr:universal stress protein [Motiliproteus sp. MSK22-1]OMH28362.1 hypothetical protein BGP75_20880 [Motiliproteus sp. MSK22-1]
MPFNNRLLIVLRAGHKEQPALNRGCLIASRLGAQIHLIADERPRHQKHKDWLQSYVDQLTAEGFQAQEAVWGKGDLIDNVLAAVRKEAHGLVIKYSDRSRPLAEALYTPRDWKLLRYVSCPVLIVRQQDSWESRPLVAAIDADPEDVDHSLLNRQILKMGSQVAEISQSPLHLVTAYPSPMQSAAREHQTEAAMGLRFRSYCESLCDTLSISPAHQEVAEGPAEVLIPKYCKQQNAGLVVMGTVARSGLRGALLGGNTAEAILTQLNADVLALKPEGYEDILQMLSDHSQAEGSSPLKEVIDE